MPLCFRASSVALTFALCNCILSQAPSAVESSPAPTQDPDPPPRRGRVVDVEGAPLAGVRVEAFAVQDHEHVLASTISDPAGVYSIEAPPHACCLEFVAKGRARVRLDLTAGRSGVDTVCLPIGVTLTGRVRDADGAPIADAVVTATDMVPNCVQIGDRTRSDAEGVFQLRHVPASQLELSIAADGFVPVRMIEVDRMSPLDLRLQRAVICAGRVVDADGEPIHAWVQALLEDGSNLGLETDDGTFRFSVPPGLRYRVHAMGSIPGEEAVTEVLQGPQADLALRFGDRGWAETLRIEVTDGATGAPVAAFRAAVLPSVPWHFEPVMALSQTPRLEGVDGVLQAPLAVPRQAGQGKVLIRAEGYAEAFAEIPNPAAANDGGSPTTTVPVRLEPERTIVGRVVDGQGMPVAGAWVWAVAGRGTSRYTGRPPHAAKTDAQGRYRCRGLGPGELHVQAWSEAHPLPRPVPVTITEEETALDLTVPDPCDVELRLTDVPIGGPPQGDWFVSLSSHLEQIKGKPMFAASVDIHALIDPGDDTLRFAAVPLLQGAVHVSGLRLGRIQQRFVEAIGSFESPWILERTQSLDGLRTSTVTGTVIGPLEALAAERWIVTTRGAFSGPMALVGSDGSFSLEVEPGDYTLCVCDLISRATLGTGTVTVERDRPSELEIDVEAASLVVEIAPPEGHDRTAMHSVKLTGAGTDTSVRLANLQGPIRWMVPPGDYQIELMRALLPLGDRGRADIESVDQHTVELRADDEVRVTLREPPRRPAAQLLPGK